MSLSSEIVLSITETLELTINTLLSEDPQTLRRLSGLQGKVICFSITDVEFSFYLVPHSEGVQIHYIYQAEADTTLQGTSLAFIEMASGDSLGSLFRGDIKFTGDIELGQTFKRIFEHLNINWEEILSRFTGDIIAHKTGNLARDITSWHQHALQTLLLDGREYLLEESHMTPQASEVEQFSTQISQLRNDTARLELRLQRLQEKLAKPA